MITSYIHMLCYIVAAQHRSGALETKETEALRRTGRLSVSPQMALARADHQSITIPAKDTSVRAVLGTQGSGPSRSVTRAMRSSLSFVSVVAYAVLFHEASSLQAGR